MKVSYNREMDIAMVEVGSKKIDYAKEAQNLIIHFSKDGEPVVLEILDASKFLTNVTEAAMRSTKEIPVKV